MKNQPNAYAEIVEGVSKSGKKYTAVQFTIYTETGAYTAMSFPTSLESGIIKKALSPLNGIYSNNGDSSLNN